MAEDKSAVQPVEAPPLTPLNLTVRLAPTPRRAPKYSVKVKNAAGQEVILGDPRATRALLALMDVHAVNGGAACHWGGPAAFAEIMAAIHGILFSTQGREWYEAFNFVNDAFAAIPGLAAKGRVNPYVLVISDNDTKLSGRISKDAYSMQPTFSAMSALGWNVISVPNGHDLQAVYLAVEKGIEQAKANPNSPVCLWTKTIKGYGIKATAENPTGGHGFPLANGEKIVDWVDEIYGGQPPEEFLNWAKTLRLDWEQKEAAKKAKAAASAAPGSTAGKKDQVQSGLAKAVVRAAQEGLPVYSISADVQGSTGISFFHKSLPERYVEVGVAEANMISTGAGFAKAGFIPVVDTFGQFGVSKGNLPLTMAALSQAPVVAMFSHVGFQDAADGASHQATTYFAAVSAIPHTTVISPSCANEAEALMYQAIKRQADERTGGKDDESYVFFVGRENYPVYWVENAQSEWGRAQVLKPGTAVVLIGCGPLLSQAIEAGKVLAAQGVEAAVINNPFINRVDLATIGKAVNACSGR